MYPTTESLGFLMPVVNPNLAGDSRSAKAAGSCTACGAPLDQADAFCPGCGTPQAAAAEPKPAAVSKFFRCQTCGAEVAADPSARSYVCPFCESTYVVEFSPLISGRQEPEFVIGFAVTPEQAAEKFRAWLHGNRWYHPGDLTQAVIEERLRGIYLPFWSFSTLAQSRWQATIGEYWYRTETYTTMVNGKMQTRTRRVRHTEWWGLEGRHHRYYSGYLVSGSRGLPQQAADRLKPFQLSALHRYAPRFLAGWLSEEYSVERQEAQERCLAEFRDYESQNIAAFLPGDTHRDLRVATDFSATNSDLILLPIYLLTFRHRDQRYRFLINGQTGQIAGDKPLSWRRISLAILAAAAVFALLWALFAWLKYR